MQTRHGQEKSPDEVLQHYAKLLENEKANPNSGAFDPINDSLDASKAMAHPDVTAAGLDPVIAQGFVPGVYHIVANAMEHPKASKEAINAAAHKGLFSALSHPLYGAEAAHHFANAPSVTEWKHGYVDAPGGVHDGEMLPTNQNKFDFIMNPAWGKIPWRHSLMQWVRWSPEHLSQLQEHPDASVRMAVPMHASAQKEHILRAIRDSDDGVQYTAIHSGYAHRHFGEEDWENEAREADSRQDKNFFESYLSNLYGYKPALPADLALKVLKGEFGETAARAAYDYPYHPKEALVAYTKSPQATPEALKQLLDGTRNPSPAFVEAVLDTGDPAMWDALHASSAQIQPELIPKAIATGHGGMIERILESGEDIDPASLELLTRHPKAGIRRHVAEHSQLLPEQGDRLLQDPVPTVAATAAEFAPLSPEGQSIAVRSPFGEIVHAALRRGTRSNERPPLSSRHLEEILARPDGATFSKAIMLHPSLSPAIVDREFRNTIDKANDLYLENFVVQHMPKFSPEHFHMLLDRGREDILWGAMAHRNRDSNGITEDVLDRMFGVTHEHEKDRRKSAKYQALLRSVLHHPNLQARHIDKVLDEAGTGDDTLAAKVPELPQVTPEQLERIVRDPKFGVYTKARAREAQRRMDPDSGFEESVAVPHGSESLRELRDRIEAAGGVFTRKQLPEQLPKAIAHILDNRGNLTVEALERAIAKMPTTKYNIEHSVWSGGQRHSDLDSRVLQIHATSDMIRKMREKGVLQTYRNMVEASHKSGHPVGKTGIGWVRYTTGNDGVFIDEIQSDLGQSFVRQAAAQARQRAAEQGMNEQEAEAFVRQTESAAKEKYSDEHLKVIQEILFAGKHPNKMLHEVFHHWLRTAKGHAGKNVAIWDLNGKAILSRLDLDKEFPRHFIHTYSKNPQDFGYVPSEYGVLETQDNSKLKGKSVWLHKLRKTEGALDWLAKAVRLPVDESISSEEYFPPEPHLSPEDHPHVQRFRTLAADMGAQYANQEAGKGSASSKVFVRDPDSGSHYILKPYHDYYGFGHSNEQVSAGWTEKMFQNVCDAVGASDLTQRSHVILHEGIRHKQDGSMSGPEKRPFLLTPLIRHRGNDAMTLNDFISNRNRNKIALHPDYGHMALKMMFLDYVGTHTDRHSGNILIAPHPDGKGYVPVAIDSSRWGKWHFSDYRVQMRGLYSDHAATPHIADLIYNRSNLLRTAQWWLSQKDNLRAAVDKHFSTAGILKPDGTVEHVSMPDHGASLNPPRSHDYHWHMQNSLGQRMAAITNWAQDVVSGNNPDPEYSLHKL